MTEQEINYDAYTLGFQACKKQLNGKKESNPFDKINDYNAWRSWNRGWNEALDYLDEEEIKTN